MTFLQKIFHIHDWKLVGLLHGEDFVPEFIGGHIDGKFYKRTIKKFACKKCQSTKREKIAGEWSMEELT